MKKKETSLEKHINKRGSLLSRSYNQRLAAALLTLATFFLASAYPTVIALKIFCFLLGPSIFIYFYLKTKNLQRHLNDLKHLKNFYRRQNRRQKGLPSQSLDQLHHLTKSELPSSDISNDLDLFKPHSLFDLLNETFTLGGQQKLINEIASPQTDPQTIKQRQENIKKLSPLIWKFVRLAILNQNQPALSSGIQHLGLLLKKTFVDKTFHRHYLISKILFTLTLCTFVASFVLKGLPSQYFSIILVLQFSYSFLSTSHLQGVFSRANDIGLHLNNLYPTFSFIEKKLPKNLVSDIIPKTLQSPPSKHMKRINFIIAGLSVQGNPFVFFILNGLLPWSYFFSKRLDNLRADLEQKLPPVLEELYHLDFLISLSFLYHFQTKTFPNISENKKTLSFTELFHPLIPRDHVVKNSFSSTPPPHLNLITGSNMAGKSTFLRTIGVNHILFLMGAPVFAKSYTSYPFHLLTCIKVEDSLDDGFSYFYAEVKRLADISKCVTNNQPSLYLVDEIFKGTNNRERIIGSQSILKTLVKFPSIGFVSTHDLELAELAKTGHSFSNFHFKDHVLDGKLIFDYKISAGPCPTTNALKIMEQAGFKLGV